MKVKLGVKVIVTTGSLKGFIGAVAWSSGEHVKIANSTQLKSLKGLASKANPANNTKEPLSLLRKVHISNIKIV